MKKLFVILSIAALCACSSNKVKVEGKFVGMESDTVTVERIGALSSSVADTIVVDEKGAFKFTVELQGGEPSLYTFHAGGRDIVLLLTPGDRIRLNSAVGMAGGYSVEGSQESELIREVTDILNNGAARLDSIMNNYSLENISEAERKSLGESYAREYYAVKREQIRFIVENSGSLAALYALYQRLPNDPYLATGGDGDLVYYRLVADSVSEKYPTSPYLATLRRQLQEATNSIEMQKTLDELMKNPMPYPEITMKDMFGKEHKLSSTLGKVVILDFWTTADANSSLNNAEMKELYEEFAEQGLEIFQVSVDSQKASWVNATQQQRLPWISVWDNAVINSVINHYALQSVPANFVIDREGNIIGRNVTDEALRQMVRKALR